MDKDVETTINQDDLWQTFATLFTALQIAEENGNLYENDPEGKLPKSIIPIYIERRESKVDKKSYSNIINAFKSKYINNEAIVEKNDTKEQKEGLSLVYDYIDQYDVSNGVNIFMAALEIHNKLWKPTDDKNTGGELEEEIQNITSRINELQRELEFLGDDSEDSVIKRAEDYRELGKLTEVLNRIKEKAKIGGSLRTINGQDEVSLRGLDIDVPPAEEAVKFMNSYLKKEKMDEYQDHLKNDNIIDYISYCVIETTKMIREQPFFDGNKRTFRALLNLLFKARNIPPVYIKQRERKAYKKALYDAMKDEDYNELIVFYLFKICDSIFELDVKFFEQDQKENTPKTR